MDSHLISVHSVAIVFVSQSSKYFLTICLSSAFSFITENNITTDNDGTFVITFAKQLENSYPNLADDTNAICSIEAAAGAHTGKYLLFDKSFYYTDSNMALAAYAGDNGPAKKICTEKELINKIKSIRNKKITS